MMTFSKSDVEYHRVGYSYGTVPAVNVKVYASVTDAILTQAYADHYGRRIDPRAITLWDDMAERDYGSELTWIGDAALEQGWEELQGIAEDIYGRGVKVYSEGRSGGWAYIQGIDTDTERWDAIDVSRWGRFARMARSIADGIPYAMASLFLINVWEPWRDDQTRDYNGTRG